MVPPFPIFRLLTGVVFFLLAMQMIENALQRLAGRRFKIFLKKHTQSKFRAVSGGVLVTGILQSSSIVNLLVLGLIGAGVIQMENGLALLLGSNLGSTINSWLLAGVGFSFSIDDYMLPVTAIAGLGMFLTKREKIGYTLFRFLFSLAFLFIALDFIKNGMSGLVETTRLISWENYPTALIVVAGLLITALVQSSSATMAIALSALYAGGISLMAAMALVLGAEAGTSLKLFLAAAGNAPVKKRVAMGNFLFNVVTMVVVYLLLHPAVQLVTAVCGSGNPLMALVLFQTLINLLGILIFWPVLGPFGRWLNRRYSDNGNESLFIHKVSPENNDAGLEALENEIRHFSGDVILHHLDAFHPGVSLSLPVKTHSQFDRKTTSEKYDYIKFLHGRMHTFALQLQKVIADAHDTERLDQLMAAIRNLMYAAKSIHDARGDIGQMSQSSNEIKYGFYLQADAFMLQFYNRAARLLAETPPDKRQDELSALFRQLNEGYTGNLQALYKENLSKGVSETEISTMINFNRSLYTAYKSVAFALKDLLLDEKQAAYFDTLPGFIR
jgi:phosphate:Na+ symporter